jgi:signal transduction histidine kinase
LAELCEELGPQAVSQQTRLVLRGSSGGVLITADRTQIAVALRSLCVNALEALVSGGTIEITLEAPSEGMVRITVADNGPGIPAQARAHVFDPFYSGREAGRGLGLGLSKCWRIVTMHGGSVEVSSAAGQGATFTVRLPAGNGR